MIAKAKFALVLLTAVFILVTPVWACASIPVQKTSAHSCCPKEPAPTKECQTPGCICLFTPPVQVAVQSNSDSGAAVEPAGSADAVAVELTGRERLAARSAGVGLEEIFLRLHQLRR